MDFSLWILLLISKINIVNFIPSSIEVCLLVLLLVIFSIFFRHKYLFRLNFFLSKFDNVVFKKKYSNNKSELF